MRPNVMHEILTARAECDPVLLLPECDTDLSTEAAAWLCKAAGWL